MVTTVSRMASASPLGFQAGDENLYRFVGNSPTNATDPSGLAVSWSIKADNLLYKDPWVSRSRGINEKVGTVVATITGRIDVDEVAKRYTLVLSITSAVKEGTNTATEWYLRDLFYSTRQGHRFAGVIADEQQYPFKTQLDGQFVPKPLGQGLFDWSEMQTDKDWPLTNEELGTLTVKKPASRVTVRWDFQPEACEQNGGGLVILIGPNGPGGKHGTPPMKLIQAMRWLTVEWSIDWSGRKGTLTLGQGPGTEPVVDR